MVSLDAVLLSLITDLKCADWSGAAGTRRTDRQTTRQTDNEVDRQRGRQTTRQTDNEAAPLCDNVAHPNSYTREHLLSIAVAGQLSLRCYGINNRSFQMITRVIEVFEGPVQEEASLA